VLPYIGGYVGFESGCGFVLTPIAKCHEKYCVNIIIIISIFMILNRNRAL
jgi:hypothetical protein